VRAAGGEVTLIDLRDYPMPLFDEDLETRDGLPEGARRFREMMLAHDALLISAPEYNSSISGVLKNAIDWASRQRPGERPLACFTGKVAGLMAASPSWRGGIRGLVTVRSILGNIDVLVVPDQVMLVRADEAFDERGQLKDAKQQALVAKLATKLVAITGKLKS
jgi:NAD(P)H-dependent FMN reductase